MNLFDADLVARLLAELDDPRPSVIARRVPVDAYTSPARHIAEQALFRRVPQVVAHGGALASAGETVPVTVGGVPLIVVRGNDGALRGFRNACRHRGTRLLSGSGPECKKAFVCPYHGWTYDLEGRLIHVPHAETFAGLDQEAMGLVGVRVWEQAGLVWVVVDPPEDGQPGIGGIGEALEQLRLGDHVVFRRAEDVRKANWKFVIEAFLENYHIRQLHRHSIYPFFLDGVIVNDWVGPHARAAVARRGLAESRDVPFEELDVRSILTANIFLFPNTIIIVHPTYVSRLTVQPLAPDRVHWTHELMIGADDDRPSRHPHFQQSWDLIEGQVFQQEDLWMVEEMHAGLAAGANQYLTMGGFEEGAARFHDLLDEHLAR